MRTQYPDRSPSARKGLSTAFSGADGDEEDKEEKEDEEDGDDGVSDAPGHRRIRHAHTHGHVLASESRAQSQHSTTVRGLRTEKRRRHVYA